MESGEKKVSVKVTISKISAIEEVKKILDSDMKILTEIANEFTIRHHEVGKKDIGDDDFVEYLFYAYYNVIRLILKKYNMIQKRS